MKARNQYEAGFTLMEVLIGLFIMGVVAVLAWRGLDTLLRSHSTVLERSATSKSEQDLVAQWVRDCETMVSNDEIDALQKGLLPFVQGNQNVWWVRSYHLP
jgi:general secretion pathway protein J